MICKKCGCRVSDTAAFCDKCGASMAEFGQKETPKPATDEKFSTMFGKVKDNKQAEIILLVAVAIIVILCAILFTNKAKAAKPFRLESGMTDKEVVEILGPRDDYDTFDTIKWGKQYLYCWYDIPLGKYSGTLQANFTEKDGKLQLGYLRWIADTASSKELKQYADRMGYDVVKTFSEKISGAKKVEERQAMTELLNYIEVNKVDKVLIYECSRLSRRAVDFLSIIEIFNEKKISLYIHQNGLETLLPNGKINPIATLVLGILAQFNGMERSLIRSRMESGYNNFRNNGGVVGRKTGYRKTSEQMKEEYAEEIRLLKKGYSLRNISKITHTSVNTLRKLSALTNIG